MEEHYYDRVVMGREKKRDGSTGRKKKRAGNGRGTSVAPFSFLITKRTRGEREREALERKTKSPKWTICLSVGGKTVLPQRRYTTNYTPAVLFAFDIQ